MPDQVSFEELAPFLSERGRMEVELASLRALIAKQRARIAELEQPTEQ